MVIFGGIKRIGIVASKLVPLMVIIYLLCGFYIIISNFLELDNIRVKNFKKFEIKGFPTKKEEHWKYTDLKTIVNNNLVNLEIIKDKKNLQYDKKLLVKEIFRDFIFL